MKKIYTIIALALTVMSGKSQTLNGNYLDINNIKAPVAADGGLFQYGNNGTEVPIGSGKTTLYSSALWLGGYDAGGQLHVAAQTYRQEGKDFYAGPVNLSGIYDAAYDSTWNRVWKIRQCDINAYSDWWTGAIQGTNPLDSAAMEVINNWPAFDGNGQALAPFFDFNGDGQYDPTVGDVPKIKGDEAIYFVYNDARGPHTETGGMPLGVQIQGMAYEFSCTNDSLLYNTVFTSYKIINKSSVTIDSTFIGNWTDMDIGDYIDDYIGCDVARGAYFGYNADQMDGNGQGVTYGANPPAEAVVFLGGPKKDANGIDDAANTTPNGFGYGDTIIDNEQLGMSGFMYFYNNSTSVNGNPGVAGGGSTDDYYQFLSGSWKSGQHWTYGGDATTGNTSCNYMYPAASDPTGFGTNMVPQTPWDELTSGIQPQDIRGVGSFGPFTFYPGAVENLDFAYIYGRATQGGNLASIAILKNRIDTLKSKFCSCNFNPTCGCSLASGIKEINHQPSTIKIYPNPATDNITINYTTTSKNYTVNIYNALGSLVKTISCKNSSTTISVGEFNSGIYLINVIDRNTSSVQRFVKQ